MGTCPATPKFWPRDNFYLIFDQKMFSEACQPQFYWIYNQTLELSPSNWAVDMQRPYIYPTHDCKHHFQASTCLEVFCFVLFCYLYRVTSLPRAGHFQLSHVFFLVPVWEGKESSVFTTLPGITGRVSKRLHQVSFDQALLPRKVGIYPSKPSELTHLAMEARMFLIWARCICIFKRLIPNGKSLM